MAASYSDELAKEIYDGCQFLHMKPELPTLMLEEHDFSENIICYLFIRIKYFYVGKGTVFEGDFDELRGSTADSSRRRDDPLKTGVSSKNRSLSYSNRKVQKPKIGYPGCRPNL